MNAPLFRLEREIIRKDWVLGGPRQANLFPVAATSSRRRVWIGNNSQCCIEEFDLEGEFIGRRYLWEIAADLCESPGWLGSEFRYGSIRGMCVAHDERLLLVVAHCNGSQRGVVVDTDHGEVFFDGLRDPIGGLFSGERFFLIDNNGTHLSCYVVAPETGLPSRASEWTATPQISDPGYAQLGRNMRGMAVCEGSIYCGIGDFHPHGQRSGLVAFDAVAGTQTWAMLVPENVCFAEPKVFHLATLPMGVELPAGDELVTYEFGHRVFTDAIIPQRRDPVSESVVTVTAACVGATVRPKHELRVAVALHETSVFYQRSATSWFGGKRRSTKGEYYWALNNVSFSIAEGEMVGIVGRNGSGKSTLCMLLAGTLHPDHGEVIRNGRVQLLALGVGFRPELTGRENVLLSGTLLGLTRKEVVRNMADIIAFSEIGEFIEEPIRTYSSGMRSRLAFAVATAVKPEILILDEAMSAGDQSFSSKAYERMQSMRANAGTVIMVSHDVKQLEKLCSRVIWLEKGQVVLDGDPLSILAQYTEFSKDNDKWLGQHRDLTAPAIGDV
ncbi:MAG: ABC transporter ATP-binding protein [Gammaproteobacteria bacterium]